MVFVEKEFGGRRLTQRAVIISAGPEFMSVNSDAQKLKQLTKPGAFRAFEIF